MAERIENYYDWDTEVSIESRYSRIAEVDWDSEPYTFDMTRVYVEAGTGKLYYATDSGCSCPTPFEDATTDDLKPIARIQDWHDHVVARTVIADPDDEYQYPEPTSPRTIDQADTARQVIEAHLKKAATHV